MRTDSLRLMGAALLVVALPFSDGLAQTQKPASPTPDARETPAKAPAEKPDAGEAKAKPEKRPSFQPSDKIPADVPSAFPTDI